MPGRSVVTVESKEMWDAEVVGWVGRLVDEPEGEMGLADCVVVVGIGPPVLVSCGGDWFSVRSWVDEVGVDWDLRSNGRRDMTGDDAVSWDRLGGR